MSVPHSRMKPTSLKSTDNSRAWSDPEYDQSKQNYNYILILVFRYETYVTYCIFTAFLDACTVLCDPVYLAPRNKHIYWWLQIVEQNEATSTILETLYKNLKKFAIHFFLSCPCATSMSIVPPTFHFAHFLSDSNE